MDLHVLPGRMKLLSVRRKDLHILTHHLLRLVLFPETPDQFISMTETPDEISIIVEEEALALLDRSVIDVCSITWRTLHITVGTMGLTESGIVSSVAAPLADAGISIFQLSTYDSDYVLVPEDKLSAAIGCLKSAFKVKDVVLLDADAPQSGEEGTARHGRLPQHANGGSAVDDDAVIMSDNVARNLGEAEHVTDASGHRRNGFSVAPYQLYLTSISHEYIDFVTAPLIKLIFFPDKPSRFFSMTRTDNTISLILDSDALNMFPEDYLNAYRESWKIIKVADGPLGFDETGIVKDYAMALAAAKVSIFYLSTFLTDYILVHRMDLKKAVNTLSRLNQSS